MTDITRLEMRTIADPSTVKPEMAKIQAVIDYATAIKDWKLLDEAVAEMIVMQGNVVGWWKEHVSVSRGGDRKSKNQVPRSADLIPMADAEKQLGISNQKISRWGKRLSDPEKYHAMLRELAYRRAMAERGSTEQKGASGTGQNEWYTPPEYIAAARDVLGDIDLDPASSDKAQETVAAKKYFTQDDDGLTQDWEGRVWLNPPYAQPLIAEFTTKMVDEYLAGHITAGIMLTHNYTDTAWFHRAAVANAICFTRGRIRFIDDKGNQASPTQGQAFFYFGPDVERFASVFGAIGFVVTPFTRYADAA